MADKEVREIPENYEEQTIAEAANTTMETQQKGITKQCFAEVEK